MELSTINHRICLVKYVKQNLAIGGPTKTPLCFKNGVFRKTTNLVQNLHDLLINGSDKTFRNMVKHHVTSKLHHKKNNQHVYWVAFIFDFCWETHVFCNLCLTGATSTLKFPIAQIATNLPCESERLQQVGLDRLVYGLRFFYIKRSWILHFGGVLSHGLTPKSSMFFSDCPL